MSRVTPEDQLKFLLSCVRHSNNGRIDFVDVAKECEIVSKGAAAKRYERLLKANGIHPYGGPTEKAPTPTTKPKSKADIMKAADAKKRKIEGDTVRLKADDDEEFKPLLKTEPFESKQMKPEPGSGFQFDSYQSFSPPFHQLSFSRSPVPYMSMQHPHTPTFPTLHQPIQSAFISPNPPRIYPLASPTTQGLQNLSNPITSSDISLSQPPPAVPQEQIDRMFEEFCSQDLYQQPNFDPHISPNPAGVNQTTGGLANSNESGISPRTADVFTGTILRPPQQMQPTVEAEDVVSTPVISAPVVKLPMGSGVNDSILISD